LNDREPQFTSKYIKELSKALETKRTISIVYYPQTGRQTERINQEIEAFVMRRFGHGQFLFSFSFIFFLVMMKRHMTSQSHDMSHDVTS